MKDKQYKAHRRILTIDGKLIADETAMSFAKTPLANIESSIAKLEFQSKMKECRNVRENRSNSLRLLRSLRLKFLNFKCKFFKFLFQHFFLSDKTASLDHIVCLGIKYDVEFTTDVVVGYGTQVFSDEVVKEFNDHILGRG